MRPRIEITRADPGGFAYDYVDLDATFSANILSEEKDNEGTTELVLRVDSERNNRIKKIIVTFEE
jgi:hypothetical protein